MIALARAFLFTALLVLTFAACSAATPPQATSGLKPKPTRHPPPYTTQEIGANIDDFFDKYQIIPIDGEILVAHHGEVVYEKSFGETQTIPRAPITPTTKFRIGALTAQFTAAAILTLQAEGKLNVRDTVCKHLTPCPAKWNRITLHQLLTHTAGITGELPRIRGDAFAGTHPTPQQLVAWYGDQPLQFAPGTGFHCTGGKLTCTSGGYVILAAVIEQVSGETYDEYLRKSFFDALAMSDTGASIPDAQLAGVPMSYDLSNAVGAGNLYSSAQDLYRWAQALDAWQQGGNSDYQALFESYIAPPNCPATYGYGPWFSQFDHSRRIFGSGELESYGALVDRYPDHDLTIVILVNRKFPPEELGAVLAKLVLGVH